MHACHVIIENTQNMCCGVLFGVLRRGAETAVLVSSLPSRFMMSFLRRTWPTWRTTSYFRQEEEKRYHLIFSWELWNAGSLLRGCASQSPSKELLAANSWPAVLSDPAFMNLTVSQHDYNRKIAGCMLVLLLRKTQTPTGLKPFKSSFWYLRRTQSPELLSLKKKALLFPRVFRTVGDSRSRILSKTPVIERQSDTMYYKAAANQTNQEP